MWGAPKAQLNRPVSVAVFDYTCMYNTGTCIDWRRVWLVISTSKRLFQTSTRTAPLNILGAFFEHVKSWSTERREIFKTKRFTRIYTDSVPVPCSKTLSLQGTRWILPMSNSLTSKLRLNKIEVWRRGVLCHPFRWMQQMRPDRHPASGKTSQWLNSEVKPTVQYINIYTSYSHTDICILRLSWSGFFGLSRCLVLAMCTPMVI